MIYNIQTENIFKWNNIIKKFSFYGKTVQELLDKINELTKQYRRITRYKSVIERKGQNERRFYC